MTMTRRRCRSNNTHRRPKRQRRNRHRSAKQLAIIVFAALASSLPPSSSSSLSPTDYNAAASSTSTRYYGSAGNKERMPPHGSSVGLSSPAADVDDNDCDAGGLWKMRRHSPAGTRSSVVRSGARGARRGSIRGARGAAVGFDGALRGGNNAAAGDDDDDDDDVVAMRGHLHPVVAASSVGNAGGSGNGLDISRMGGAIDCRSRRARTVKKVGTPSAEEAETSSSAGMETMDGASLSDAMIDGNVRGDDIDAISTGKSGGIIGRELISNAYYAKAALSFRGGSASAMVEGMDNIMADSYVIETPLFPIILPKAWGTNLEISVAMDKEIATTAADSTTDATKPSPQLLRAATRPLLRKDAMDSFTGREFYHPESMEALAETGCRMTLPQGRNPHVRWTGDKRTEAFVREHGADNGLYPGAAPEWYAALDASQEVLVWAGKFTCSEEEGYYGAELPIVKTISVIHKSPRYLAELLMDSKRVQVYNKMSLGRTDEKIFQTGIDTQGGAFGDGESKVVRNLTKPPMVKSLLEFLTCMHARKLRPGDMSVLLSPDEEPDGYIVVSRAVTGGEWSNDDGSASKNDGEKRVRNEILLGVNILKAVPGEPNKTELTAVTHVYSPMIPLMLAKSAGVKGAVDFVRDIRALP